MQGTFEIPTGQLADLADITLFDCLDDVIENRDLDPDVVETIKRGGLFLGKDALGMGLVDELGTWQDAKDIVKNETGAIYPQFVEMRKKGLNIFDLISGFM